MASTDFQSTLKATHTWIQPSSSRSLIGHRCARASRHAWIMDSGLWTGTAALMRHSSRARALHARTWHRRPLRLRLRFRRLAPRWVRHGLQGQPHSFPRRRRLASDETTTSLQTVAVHWQWQMEIAIADRGQF
jgi:hypothetical protein